MQRNPGSPRNMKFTDNADMLATITECAEEALHKYSKVASDLIGLTVRILKLKLMAMTER